MLRQFIFNMGSTDEDIARLFAKFDLPPAAIHELYATIDGGPIFDQIDVSCVYPVTTDTEFFEVSASIGRREPGKVHAPGKFVQSPQTVARAIMRCLRKPKPEVWPAPLLRWGAGLALLMPRLTQRSLVRHAKKDRKRLPPPHRDATAS